MTMASAKASSVHMKAGVRDTRALIDARARLVARPRPARSAGTCPTPSPTAG
ncbi:hypothetical protein O1M54_12745 [Streptomyces diastatochromogenes]|nr:hypothetical protein [Streptomyces diastatochromogenes]